MKIKSIIIRLKNGKDVEINMNNPCEELVVLYNQIKDYSKKYINFTETDNVINGEFVLPVKINDKTKIKNAIIKLDIYKYYYGQVLLYLNGKNINKYKDSIFIKLADNSYEEMINIDDFIALLKLTYTNQKFGKDKEDYKSISYKLLDDDKCTAHFDIVTEKHISNKNRKYTSKYMIFCIQYVG